MKKVANERGVNKKQMTKLLSKTSPENLLEGVLGKNISFQKFTPPPEYFGRDIILVFQSKTKHDIFVTEENELPIIIGGSIADINHFSTRQYLCSLIIKIYCR